MITIESQDVERKVLCTLKILRESNAPLGARIIARRLKDDGIELSERAVRYHLKLMDERGLTQLVGRDGRLITEEGIEELRSALVQDKVGFAISKIELLAFRTDFNWRTQTGCIPINISFFAKDKFKRMLQAMTPVFKSGLCAGDRVAVAEEGNSLGGLRVPSGKIGIATTCSIVVNGALLKAGIPIDSRFGGILQIRDHKPVRFVELIHYSGSSLDPSEVFIRGKMTSVSAAAKSGKGSILANFRELPAICMATAEEVIAGLRDAGITALLLMGNTSEAICETPVVRNRVGMILIGGLNPIAAVEEAGIEVENRAMCSVMEYQDMLRFDELVQ
ncbi:MAG: NrpR regulatory domain-containing protein [Chloroflexota bacterium]|nr:NrpR regulatory domain-containing protein [Chloroflexota bacterium]